MASGSWELWKEVTGEMEWVGGRLGGVCTGREGVVERTGLEQKPHTPQDLWLAVVFHPARDADAVPKWEKRWATCL